MSQPDRLDPGLLLETPKTHQRSESSYLRNYLLLNIYDELPQSDDVHSDASDRHLSNITDETYVTGKSGSSSDPNDTIAPEVTAQNAPDRNPHLNVQKQASLSQMLEGEYDVYGFKKQSQHYGITRDQYDAQIKQYWPHVQRRRKKWDLLMKHTGLDYEVPTRFPPRSDKVKKMVRKGIPPEWRGNAWFFYAGGYERLGKNLGLYDKLVESTAGIHNKDTEVIERDLHRTFPDNIHFQQHDEEPAMIKSLRQVLVAFAQYQPQIGYCQLLNFLAGLLLLFMSEERAFWMLVILTERIIPKVHAANLEGVHTDQGVLMLCVREYIPQLWGILGKTFDGSSLSPDKILTRLPPVTLVTSSWFMLVFVGVLPFESLLRVWDILWYEGSKTIFRISLTILKLCQDDPGFVSGGKLETDQIELFQFVQNFPKTIVDPNLLIDNCFKKIGGYGFGSLSQDEINKCREFVTKERSKLQNKKGLVTAHMSEDERRALGSGLDDVHDVYGFHRSIMSGVVWNKNLSTKMKKKFRKPR